MEQRVQCCIAGGGPAGMMLGVLLARAGVSVVVLEKHADFLRDFRGDTVHPSTLEIMYQLGYLEDFLKLPHERVQRLAVQIGDETFSIADFSYLNPRSNFIAMVPQWDLLNFLAERGRRYPGFKLEMNARVTDLIEEDGRVQGVRAETASGSLDVRAPLTIGADGRTSDVRAKARLVIDEFGAPIDVFWMRVSRRPDDPGSGGRMGSGRFVAMIARGDYWQLAFVIPKGGAESIRQKGLPAFRQDIASVAPFLADRVSELQSWDSIKLLTVRIDRLRRWYKPGLLCLGDCAHAMSPIGGVGINLAIQDAVAAANGLAKHLRDGTLAEDHLAQVQTRREFPTRVIQRIQIAAQNRLIGPVLASSAPLRPPWPIRLLNASPLLQRIPARIVGVGIRPERVAAFICEANGHGASHVV